VTDRNETENDRQSETLCYFFRHKLFKYIFMVLDDQRILEYLIVNVQVQLEQGGKKILKLPLSEDDHYAYRQVKNFLESEKEGACDGLIVTGLNALIYRHGAKAIELLNTSRDAFSRFRLPIVFVVNLEILKRIIRGAPDLYNMRDLPDLHFEGTWATNMDILASSFRDYSQHELTNIDLKIQLLEKQLKRTEAQGAIDDDSLNNLIIPLLILYLEQGNLKKMEPLYQQYIKGNEHRVKDKEVLGRYQRKSAKPVISKEVDNKYIENRMESRRQFIREGEWDTAAEVTFELESYLTLHGFPQRSIELLQELDIEKLNETNQLVTYGRMGTLYQHFGEYDKSIAFHQKASEIAQRNNDLENEAVTLHQIGRIYQEKGNYDAALAQYQKAKEILEKIGDIKNISHSFGQIGTIYQLKGDVEAALIQHQKSLEIAEKIGDIKSAAASFHNIGMIYQEKGNYNAALTQYRKSLKIREKIGDIQGVAISMGQMGKLYFEQNQYETALKYSIQAFLFFDKIGSPNANIVKNNISLCRQKLPEERFNAILKEYGVMNDE